MLQTYQKYLKKTTHLRDFLMAGKEPLLGLTIHVIQLVLFHQMCKCTTWYANKNARNMGNV